MTKQKDFYWVEEREPHLDRRKEILKKHPEVKSLFGKNPFLPWSTLIMVILQVAVALNISKVMDLPYGWIYFILLAYIVGATLSHALFLAIHEITHELAFKKTAANNWLSFIANIPILLPYAMSFKEYHAMHHWDQGVDGVDADIPLESEAKFFNSLFGKIIWFVHQIVFYAVRPMFVKALKVNKWFVLNFIFQITAMAIILPLAGWWGLAYFALSLVFAGGLHPTSGHFISEHYVFKEGQETYSYYGPLNLLTFNVGYHNEHHDFPTVPGNKLPALKKMAPEFYDNLHSYDSWTGVIFKFLFDKNISLFSRTKRKKEFAAGKK
jgi:sphingolipid 4-desaturase/C4-monooxygenase